MVDAGEAMLVVMVVGRMDTFLLCRYSVVSSIQNDTFSVVTRSFHVCGIVVPCSVVSLQLFVT